MNDSICLSCKHYYYLPAQISGPVEACYPAESECTEDSDNFGTDDGCYHYERDYRKEEA